jgi:hypothetical protein
LQPPFVRTPAMLANLESALSSDRFATYLAAVGGDRRRAILLYEWNGAVSAAFYFPLQAVEVALRNACHRELTSLFGPTWHNEARFLALDPRTAQAIDAAREHVRRLRLPVDAPHMVAELAFGFWTNLFGHRFDRAVWVPGLYRVFPRFRRVSGTPLSRSAVARRFDYLRTLRNRIAHHESLLEVADWMYPDLRVWIENVSTCNAIIAARPPIAPA